MTNAGTYNDMNVTSHWWMKKHDAWHPLKHLETTILGPSSPFSFADHQDLAMLGFWLQHCWDKKPLRRLGSFVHFPLCPFKLNPWKRIRQALLASTVVGWIAMGWTWHLGHGRKLFWRLVLTRSIWLAKSKPNTMTNSLRFSSMVPEIHL